MGVSYNKIFAKLGSDLRKPDATTVISSSRFQEMIWPLPVSEPVSYTHLDVYKRQRQIHFHIFRLLFPEILAAQFAQDIERMASRKLCLLLRQL